MNSDDTSLYPQGGSEEALLRRSLRDLLLQAYGLSEERPTRPRTPSAPRREAPHPTFSTGSAPKSSSWTKEESAIPGRRKILVGHSVRMADKLRPSLNSGARIPGESDRDFIERKAKIRAAHRRGLGAPKRSVAGWHDEAWEMGQ